MAEIRLSQLTPYSPSDERRSPLTVRLDREEDELVDEQAPLLTEREGIGQLQTKQPVHPFIKLLWGIWPFGASFRALRIWGKAYEIVKVLEY